MKLHEKTTDADVARIDELVHESSPEALATKVVVLEAILDEIKTAVGYTPSFRNVEGKVHLIDLAERVREVVGQRKELLVRLEWAAPKLREVGQAIGSGQPVEISLGVWRSLTDCDNTIAIVRGAVDRAEINTAKHLMERIADRPGSNAAAARLILSRLLANPEVVEFDGESRTQWIARAEHLINEEDK